MMVESFSRFPGASEERQPDQLGILMSATTRSTSGLALAPPTFNTVAGEQEI